jgi:hypothetical protein
VTNSEMRSHRYRLARASAMSKPAEALPPTQSGCGAGTLHKSMGVTRKLTKDLGL